MRLLMQRNRLRALLAASLCAGLVAVPVGQSAQAQFGLPGLPGPRIGVPLPVPGVRVGPGVGIGLPLPGLYGPRGLGRTLGIIGVVAVGAVTLHRLNVQDRREVTRRARVVVEKDQNERVVDSYKTKDGMHQVTVTADPVQKAGDFVDDPALQKIEEAKATPEPKAQPKAGTKSASSSTTATASEQTDLVKLTELPADTDCRRVTTELESKVQPAKGKPQPTVTEASKQTNVSIMCKTDTTTWKPAGA